MVVDQQLEQKTVSLRSATFLTDCSLRIAQVPGVVSPTFFDVGVPLNQRFSAKITSEVTWSDHG